MRSRALANSVSAVAAISMLMAGCGGGSSTNAAATAQTGVLAYAHCMHSHGVPNFPDPDSSGAIPKNKIIALGDGPQFRAAESACLHLMPATGLGPEKDGPPNAHAARGRALVRQVRARPRVPELPRPD